MIQAIPKPLFRRLVLTIMVGTGCFFIGLLYYFTQHDIIFLILSSLLFTLSLIKGVSLFYRIKYHKYEVMEGSCLEIAPLQKYKKIVIADINEKKFEILIAKNIQIEIDSKYRIFFKSSTMSQNLHPLLLKMAMHTDNFLGIETIE